MEQPLEGVRGPTHCASRAGLCLGLSMGTGHEFRKPIIWVSPSRVVALGGSVTIRCEGQDPGMTFFLHKAGHLNLQRQMVPDGPVAEFPIPSIGREDGGNYTCDYQSITDQNRWSNLSDPIEIIVAGEGPGSVSWLPAPPPARSSGGLCTDGTFRARLCSGPSNGDARLAQSPISRWWCCAENPAVLAPIPPALSTRPPSPPRARGRTQESCSQPSQQRSQGDMRFMLNKEGRHFPPVDSDGFEAEFSSSNVRREYGGSYSCSYHSRSEPFTMSYPSDPMELVVRGEGPGSASLFPAPGPAGSDVTIRCQGQRQDVRFFLHKAGDLNPQRHMDPAGAGAEFHIPSVGRQHGGSYSCSYRPRSEPFVSSQPSDTVQLVVTSKRPGSLLISLSEPPSNSPLPPAAAPPKRLDFTHANIACLGLCAGVLLILGLILAEAYYSRPRGTP
uniref:Ig-like domain-containing protein n=1 Tax=Chelonoidis abingdonii TaxID=106734 RepID=A0A8C0H5S1_CHEAB